MEVLVEYLAKGFMTMLAISMPCVLTAAAIGLVVGIIQAVTQVQEQTIAAAPKIIAVFFGANIVEAKEPVHGKCSEIYFEQNEPLFRNISNSTPY